MISCSGAGQFAAAAPWGTGPAYKQSLLDYPHACILSVFVRDKSEGSITPDEQGRPKISYKLNGYDRKTMVQARLTARACMDIILMELALQTSSLSEECINEHAVSQQLLSAI